MRASELPFAPQVGSSPRGALIRAAIMTALLPMAGCACMEADWERFVQADASAVSVADYPECNFANLKQHSRVSAALADQADPQLLAEAKDEAEQDCLREKSQRRLDVSGGWHAILK